MGAAIGLAATLVVMAIFLPSVLSALEVFMIEFLETATDVVRQARG